MIAAFLIAFWMSFPFTARAQGAPAREYLNTPVNQARFFLDFVGSSGETAAESALPLPDNESVSRLGSASLLYSFPLLDRYGGVALSGNYARVKFKGPNGSSSAPKELTIYCGGSCGEIVNPSARACALSRFSAR